MKPILIKVPKRLTLETTVKFANQICDLPDSNRYIFDFDRVGRIEPFALLFLSSELQRCRSKHSDSDFEATNYKACTYAAHMGFFRAFGLDHGKKPGEAKGSSTYLPINIFDTNENGGRSCRDCIGNAHSARTSPITKLKISSDIHQYSLEISVKLLETPDQDFFRFSFLWPKQIPISKAVGFEEGEEQNIDGKKYMEYALFVEKRLWPGQKMKIVGGKSSAALEYEFNDNVYSYQRSMAFDMYYTLFLQSWQPVQGEIPFDSLNIY